MGSKPAREDETPSAGVNWKLFLLIAGIIGVALAAFTLLPSGEENSASADVNNPSADLGQGSGSNDLPVVETETPDREKTTTEVVTKPNDLNLVPDGSSKIVEMEKYGIDWVPKDGWVYYLENESRIFEVDGFAVNIITSTTGCITVEVMNPELFAQKPSHLEVKFQYFKSGSGSSRSRGLAYDLKKDSVLTLDWRILIYQETGGHRPSMFCWRPMFRTKPLYE